MVSAVQCTAGKASVWWHSAVVVHVVGARSAERSMSERMHTTKYPKEDG